MFSPDHETNVPNDVYVEMVKLFKKFPSDDECSYSLEDIPKFCLLGPNKTRDRAQAAVGVNFESEKELQKWLKDNKIKITGEWEGIFV